MAHPIVSLNRSGLGELTVLEARTAQGLSGLLAQIRIPVIIHAIYYGDGKHIAIVGASKKLNVIKGEIKNG